MSFNTKQKNLILDIINSSSEHLSAQEIYRRCRLTLPNISLGTVYRNLNALVESNQIRKIKTLDNTDRFDHLLKAKHDHFICTECGRIIDTNLPISIPEYIGENEVNDYELIIKGICDVCKKGRK